MRCERDLRSEQESSGAVSLAAAILAGGKARRLGGVAKGLLTVDAGKPMLCGLIEQVGLAGISDLLIVANDIQSYAPLGRLILSDFRPGAGPLGGIETALRHFTGRHGAVLVLPCDLPGMSVREIANMRAAYDAGNPRVVVATDAESHWHPLCAILRTDILEDVSRAIDLAHLSVARLWKSLGAVTVTLENPRSLFNLNTPQDLTSWQQRS